MANLLRLSACLFLCVSLNSFGALYDRGNGLIYDDVLQIDEDTNIDTLATELSLIGAKSNLNGETLPDLDEFKEHKELVNSALTTAQDLHGRLVASLRNNENEVALTLISAIELNLSLIHISEPTRLLSI